MKTRLLYLTFVTSLFWISVPGQKLATLTVDAGDFNRYNTVVSASMEGLTLGLESNDLEIRELTHGEFIVRESQLEGGIRNTLWWVMPGETSPHQKRIFELWKIPKQNTLSRTLTIENNGKALTVKSKQKKVLSYQYKKPGVPAGVDPVFDRAGYIHPLWTPEGEILTRIQPPDHYHHYGIWNPWTSTEFRGQEVDFWNLVKKQGRVDVTGVPSYSAGHVYAEVRARHDHLVITDTIKDLGTPALNEDLNIRIWDNFSDKWQIDFTSQLSTATEEPLIIKEYRYQGFGWRGKPEWNDKNVTLLTSEGKDKETGNATRARWCDVNGPSSSGTSGILFLTHPGNYNYPELLRIWPTGSNEGKENVFVNFNPTQDRDWRLEAQQSNTLKYRMIVYDGEITNSKREMYWNDFAHPPKVSVRRANSLTGKKILVYTKNGEGFVHDNIANSVRALKKLGRENGFLVDATDSASIFTSPDLDTYDAIVFSNTNNKTFDNERQKVAFQEYIRSGKGFVGIHSATGSERSWPWYWKLVGGKFVRHPRFQRFEVEVIDKNHPSTDFLPDVWVREDECYFINKLNPANHILLAARLPDIVDEKKVEYPGDTFGEYVPLSWCHEFDGGRQWYTALGHAIEHYDDPTFMRHILGGIEWVTRRE